MRKHEIENLLVLVEGLAAFRGVLDDRAVRKMLDLLRLLCAESPEPGKVAGAFGRLWEELAAGEENLLLPDAWRSRLVSALLDGESVFGRFSERGEAGPELLDQGGRDLRTVKNLFDLQPSVLDGLLQRTVPDLKDAWAPWKTSAEGGFAGDDSSPREEVARRLAASGEWEELAADLAEHFRRHGSGMFGRYRAFRWQDGSLRPVVRPDPVRVGDLVGYERERAPLAENLDRLLAGLPAQHALLYGPPGTGKSSTVKALASERHERELRLVEIAKEDLGELPNLLEVLRDRGMKFVVFVDDLSFEENEVEYKALKALLEGSIEAPPPNVRVYATSNRRNLIRESFSEREGDDVHAQDTAREKLSLAARFGLRVTFPLPDQREYLNIVRTLARARGLETSDEELEHRALAHERWSPARSGRAARQFVDDLQADLKRNGKEG